MIKNPPTQQSKLQHLPELDSLRTLAVFMTLLAHFSPVNIPYMWYGVPIFFTISGFLITTILLRTVNENPAGSKLVVIKNFMVRRVLRLFPIYYLFIIFFWLAKKYLALYLWKDEFTPYFFTYTPNFLIHKIGSDAAGCFSHLWSLGVEEQFYLFWPWILLFPAEKYRLPVIFSMIGVSLIYIFINYTDSAIGALTFTNFHTLGAGAILACLYVRQDAVIDWLKGNRHLLFNLTFLHLVIVLIFFKNESGFWHLYREISLCLCTFSIVLVSIFGWKGIIGYITRNKQVQYIGMISYGIYLYHMPVPFVYRAIAGRFFPSATHLTPLVFMVLCFAITIVLAAFSYEFIEKRFLRLKRYFA
jgi:peptidoglycan/LPS O-acetylase OafA/YrhL